MESRKMAWFRGIADIDFLIFDGVFLIFCSLNSFFVEMNPKE